jgi:hypothetical protein
MAAFFSKVSGPSRHAVYEERLVRPAREESIQVRNSRGRISTQLPAARNPRRGRPGLHVEGFVEYERQRLGATSVGDIHSCIGCEWPQSRHRVVGKWVRQLGQTAPVWKVSNVPPQLAHFQYEPTGGAVLQLGH